MMTYAGRRVEGESAYPVRLRPTFTVARSLFYVFYPMLHLSISVLVFRIPGRDSPPNGSKVGLPRGRSPMVQIQTWRLKFKS